MERYRSIIGDWDSFLESLSEFKQTAVRKNSIKAGEEFEEKMEREFGSFEQSSWNPEVYRLETDQPGKSMMHWLGQYYVQEESATLPVEVLDPRPGEKILDVAAAPGGKATQIASRIENRGTVTGNDSSSKRLQSLQANTYRMGAASVVTTNYDGRSLPEDERYDRILVDAPCTGEGDRLRRGKGVAPEEHRESLSTLQKALVEKAAKLLKPGGTMVYSTCTIAPEENEEVARHALEETGLSLENIETDAPHVRGVEQFQDFDYGSEMSKTVRIYPHHLDSGVIYVARFKK